MVHRAFAVVIAALFVLSSCGGEEGEQQEERQGYKAAPATKPPESKEGKELAKKMEMTAKVAQQVVKKEKVEQPPITAKYFVDSEAFEVAGFQVSSLKKEIKEEDTRGVAYVKVEYYDGKPETANIYDELGNHLNIVSYLWERDDQNVEEEAKIWGSVYKGNDDRMLGMQLYCMEDSQLYVHNLSSFRVHAAFSRKVTIDETSVTVVLMHATTEGRPAWPKCEELGDWHSKAVPYQSPFGMHKYTYTYDESGNLTLVEYRDKKGELVENQEGIARRILAWDEGRIAEEAWYTKGGLLSKYIYKYDEKGNRIQKAVVDANGKPTVDYFGDSYYQYEYDRRGRVVTETRLSTEKVPVEIHEYTYAKFNQVEIHVVKDGKGNIKTTYVNEYMKKGARTKLSVFDGDAKDGNLKLDYNGVALYKWSYTDRGKPVEDSRHGTTQVVGVDGKQDYKLVNARDGWARITTTYDDKGSVISILNLKVDTEGRPLYQKAVDEEGNLLSTTDWTYDGALAKGSVRTEFKDSKAMKKVHLDAKDEVRFVELMTYNGDDEVSEIAYFMKDEKTPSLGDDGYHKMVRSFDPEGKRTKDNYLDAASLSTGHKVYEYTNGVLSKEAWFDKDGKELKSITYVFDAEGNLKDIKKEGF